MLHHLVPGPYNCAILLLYVLITGGTSHSCGRTPCKLRRPPPHPLVSYTAISKVK
jgi:hypothetical protein